MKLKFECQHKNPADQFNQFMYATWLFDFLLQPDVLSQLNQRTDQPLTNTEKCINSASATPRSFRLYAVYTYNGV